MNDKDFDLVVNQMAELYRQELRRVNAVASGDLVNFRSDVEVNDDTINIVFYLEDYYKYVENGRKPGGCPISDIRKWVQTRNIVPRPNKKGVPITREQLVFAIANSIRNNGYKGRHPLSSTLNSQQFHILNNKLFEVLGLDYDEEINSELDTLTNLKK